MVRRRLAQHTANFVNCQEVLAIDHEDVGVNEYYDWILQRCKGLTPDEMTRLLGFKFWNILVVQLVQDIQASIK